MYALRGRRNTRRFWIRFWVDVYVGEGIEALKLQLYDSLTLRYCLSNTVYYFYSLIIRTLKYRFYTNYWYFDLNNDKAPLSLSWLEFWFIISFIV
jgi:hypothetical protein